MKLLIIELNPVVIFSLGVIFITFTTIYLLKKRARHNEFMEEEMEEERL